MSLAQYVVNDPGWFDSSQALVQALELECETLVVDAQLVQHGGVQVSDCDGIVDHVVAEVVRLTIHHSALDAASGHPA